MSAYGTKRTCRDDLLFVCFWGKADVGCEPALMETRVGPKVGYLLPTRERVMQEARSAPLRRLVHDLGHARNFSPAVGGGAGDEARRGARPGRVRRCDVSNRLRRR